MLTEKVVDIMVKLYSKVKMKKDGRIGVVVYIDRDIYLIEFMEWDTVTTGDSWLDWRAEDDFIVLPTV